MWFCTANQTTIILIFKRRYLYFLFKALNRSGNNCTTKLLNHSCTEQCKKSDAMKNSKNVGLKLTFECMTILINLNTYIKAEEEYGIVIRQ